MRTITIEPMSNDFRDRVLNLTRDASFTHRHLDWHSVEYWLDKQPGFVYVEDGRVCAWISCCEDPKNIAWVHIFCVSNDNLIRYTWKSLFEQVKEYYSSWQKITFAAIPLSSRFESELKLSGFHSENHIVVFHKLITDLPASNLLSDVLITPVNILDYEVILEIDHHAFEPLWQLTADSLLEAMKNSFYCSKAVINKKPVAYQLSTKKGSSVHLARIAVLPDYHGKGIARALLDDLFLYAGFNQNEELTVNTQSDNARSIQLYQAFGFSKLPDSYPIYTA